jgi:hypothetical protein
MIGTRKVAGLAIVAALCLTLGNGRSALARPQATAGGAQDQGANKQAYTMPQFNGEQACAQEKNPTTQVRCFDDLLAKYPDLSPELLKFIFPLYMQSYGQLKDYQHVIVYADKMVGLGEKIDAIAKFNAYYSHAMAYTTLLGGKGPWQTDPTLAKGTIGAVTSGLTTLDTVKKPDGVTDDAWAAQLKQFKIALNSVGAQAATVQKDYPTVINFYKAVLAVNPEEPITNYNLGRTFLLLNPPQQMDAMWYVARAVSSKNATQQQVTQIKPYLRKLIENYQGGSVCDSITDSELNEILQLAASSADRPSSYSIASGADLDNARKDMTIATVMADLKAGGDKSKLTWMASCGLEFPGMIGKVIEVVAPAAEGQPVVLKIAFVTSDAEFDSKTTADMEVKIPDQPQVAKMEKDSPVHFSGFLTSYDPDPAFMMHWEKGKVAEEDLPKEKTTPKKTTKRPTKRPSGH